MAAIPEPIPAHLLAPSVPRVPEGCAPRTAAGAVGRQQSGPFPAFRPRRRWRPAARLRALVAWSRAARVLWHAAAYCTLCAAGVALYLLLSDPHPPVLPVAAALGAVGLMGVGIYAAGREGR